MKVSHFNTSTGGGAAIAARRLHDALVQRGVDSTFFFRYGANPNSSYARIFNGNPNIIQRIERSVRNRLSVNKYLNGRPPGYEDFSFGRLGYRTPATATDGTTGIIHLHWIASFLDYPSFFNSIDDTVPIIWTLHDMNPFTGGCHYSWECEGYRSGCGNCPQLGVQSENDLSAINYEVKRNAIATKNLHVVADSHWLEGAARTSELLAGAQSFRTIHYGLDHNQFRPRDKHASRSVLGIDPDCFVIVAGADAIDNRRKGMLLLVEAVRQLTNTQQILLLTFGRGDLQHSELGNVTVRSMGFVGHADLMSIIYSAGDIFVIPSLYEAFGQTSLEAMACATPVVGFETGGIPDMVHEGETGLLAKAGDVHHLYKQIEWMTEHPDERQAMGERARRMIEEKFTLNVQAGAYIDMYRSLLDSE